jgi:hypothetical protein
MDREAKFLASLSEADRAIILERQSLIEPGEGRLTSREWAVIDWQMGEGPKPPPSIKKA